MKSGCVVDGWMDGWRQQGSKLMDGGSQKSGRVPNSPIPIPWQVGDMGKKQEMWMENNRVGFFKKEIGTIQVINI